MTPPPCPPIERRHAIPDGVQRIVAIGDVHGRADCLRALLAHVEATNGVRRTAIVLLGDLVDRGPASREVLALAHDLLARRPDSVLCLGNHDDWFRRFLRGDPDFADRIDLWLAQGGEETLRSFDADPFEPDDARRMILRDHPGCLALLDGAAMLTTAGELLFVHAGIDPARSLAEQDSRTCLWVRSPFLEYRGALPALVLHGHTPQSPALPHVTENRISLDTGAFATGILTAFDFDRERGEACFWATSPMGTDVARVRPRLVDRGFGTALEPDREDVALYRLRPLAGAQA